MKKILVIQNNGDEFKDLESVLSKDEFEIFYSINLNDGLEISARYVPDLIVFFLSSDSPGMEVLHQIGKEEKTAAIPLIVISQTPSFDQQRRVMELGADDYIPNWLMEKSLLNAISLKIDKLNRLKVKITNQINTFEELSGAARRDDHILIKIGNKLKLVKYTEIICITALKEYSKLVTKDNCKIVVRKSLKNWLSVLPTKSFLQIHRATIINIDFIEKIVKTNERTYTAHLKHIDETFDFSHRYANVMRQTFPS